MTPVECDTYWYATKGPSISRTAAEAVARMNAVFLHEKTCREKEARERRIAQEVESYLNHQRNQNTDAQQKTLRILDRLIQDAVGNVLYEESGEEEGVPSRAVVCC